MKSVGKIIWNAIVVIWLIIALFVTVCLLSYNEFKVTTFGNTALIVVDSDELEPDYKEGDLLIVKRNSDAKINIGDDVFYYNSDLDSNVLIYHGKVENKTEVNQGTTTYHINGSKVTGDYVAGKIEGSKVYHNVGKLLGVFTSKWGFMFLVIFPSLFAIIYEIMMIADAARNNKKDSE